MIYMTPQQITEKYGRFKGVLHIGSHYAEERDDYISAGIARRVWVDANPVIAQELSEKISSTNDTVVLAAVSEFDNETVRFNVANNGQSSSILPMKLHRNFYDGIFYTGYYEMKTVSLKTLVENIPQSEELDMINLDIQGVELRALRGLGDKISQFRAIYTEVNTLELYENCDLMHELDEYLMSREFEKIGFMMYSDHGWGDALYLRRQ